MDFASINQPPKQPTALALSYVKSGAWDSRLGVCVYLLVCGVEKEKKCVSLMKSGTFPKFDRISISTTFSCHCHDKHA
jgi:hypothetical protein